MSYRSEHVGTEGLVLPASLGRFWSLCFVKPSLHQSRQDNHLTSPQICSVPVRELRQDGGLLRGRALAPTSCQATGIVVERSVFCREGTMGSRLRGKGGILWTVCFFCSSLFSRMNILFLHASVPWMILSHFALLSLCQECHRTEECLRN